MAKRQARGLFVVFEGGDGTGKSTQAALLADRLRSRGRRVLLTREPGGTSLGDRLRDLLLDPATGDVSSLSEALLYAADKAQHVHEVIRPALDAGVTVVCDRYIDSMLAYQGAGRGLDFEGLARVTEWATGGLLPDLTVVLDIDPSEALARKTTKDRLEAAGGEFHRRARELFVELAGRAPDRYLVLPALADRAWTLAQVAERVEALRVAGDVAAGPVGS